MVDEKKVEESFSQFELKLRQALAAEIRMHLSSTDKTAKIAHHFVAFAKLVDTYQLHPLLGRSSGLPSIYSFSNWSSGVELPLEEQMRELLVLFHNRLWPQNRIDENDQVAVTMLEFHECIKIVSWQIPVYLDGDLSVDELDLTGSLRTVIETINKNQLLDKSIVTINDLVNVSMNSGQLVKWASVVYLLPTVGKKKLVQFTHALRLWGCIPQYE